MRLDDGQDGYILGNSDVEHERLIRQAKRLAPVTENFFREAGIGPGQRVLDLGSGVGDVAMLAARLVGPSGEVVAIEREARSVNRARIRAADAGLQNVRFVETNIAHFSSDAFFDAAVGRYILQFLPDPVATLRSVAGKVRPAGSSHFRKPLLHPSSLCLSICHSGPQAYRYSTKLPYGMGSTWRWVLLCTGLFRMRDYPSPTCV